ncbi:hypothetical protein DOTSEDRAFT_72659 [Dothistroma septosporum NZE10]|uniref:Telomeric single stranded DNA binding POT1/Cdc13 domain-containing protein n=1 Tax=Dothistroma septosporum (strain NZE10 / CBS 128990) TaxID=675120 RepID=M2YMZ4_DOTSN|nr:hypothetical protein DOTSEDRAFT_72659 [Dothistroma septosporum NZE10]
MMATISIASLSPSEPPPADKSIRAIVSLLWPYSSSTKQCALLLAERDFRLRNHRGQIRVRFQGASAPAVAKSQVGIGDEVVLELRGSAWAGDVSNAVTPGKSVEGELLFIGELAIRLVKKADGREVDVSIRANETTPPPEERDADTTPARPIPSYLRSSLGGADVVPIYSSPAFVKRMRLSGGYGASWDPFADVDRELGTELAHSRKKQKVGFGGIGRWKFAARTLSPEKEYVQMTTTPSAEQNDEITSFEGHNTPVARETREQAAHACIQQTPGSALPSHLSTVNAGPSTTASVMAPPPLPRPEMPDGFDRQPTYSDSDPHTPKLQPVPSSALPLPSPFPAETKQLQAGIPSSTAAANDHQGASLAEEAVPNCKDAEAIERSGHVPLHTEASQDLLDAVEENQDDRHHPILPGQPSFSSSVASTVPPEQASGVFHDSGSDHDNDDSDNVHADHHVQRHRIPHPEYASDTEEDEVMYTQYGEQADAELGDAVCGRNGPDHSDQLGKDDIEEVIDDMGEPPESDDPDDEVAEPQSPSAESDDEDVGNLGGQPQIRPRRINVSSGLVDARPDARPQAAQTERQEQLAHTVADELDMSLPSITPTFSDDTIKLSQVGSALSSTFGQQPQANASAQLCTQTPARPLLGLFSLDGASDLTKARTSTPQSERDRVMKKTYSSLFGFAKSPSPENTQPAVLDVETPTPVSSSIGFSKISKDRFAAAGIPIEEPVKERPASSGPIPEESRNRAAATTGSATETPVVEMPVTARAIVTDTQTPGSDLAASTGSAHVKQMAVSTRATLGETLSPDRLPTAPTFFKQAGPMPVPTRATTGDAQSLPTESSSTAHGARIGQDAFGHGGGTIPEALMNDDTSDVLVEPAAATEEIGQVSQAGDVDDGSLLEAVPNAVPRVHDEQEQINVLVEQSSVVEETPIERVQEFGWHTPPEKDRLQADDAVPDDVANNPSLAAAMEPGTGVTDLTTAASSAPRPSQVEVIDLGDSSDVEEEGFDDTASARGTAVLPSQPADSISGSTPPVVPGPNTESYVGADSLQARATDCQQIFERFLSQAGMPRHRGNESITQVSQGSILQSDMLDTTQTTVDGRSEIATPYMDDVDTIVLDTSYEESIGVFQGQPNFFDDQMHGQEFEGNAAPPLTQNIANAVSDRYNYNLSFQSATSVATDNSDHHQANATQRDGAAGPIQEETSMVDSSRGDGSQFTVLEAEPSSTAVPAAHPQAPQVATAQLSEAPQDKVFSESITFENQESKLESEVESITYDAEMHDGELHSSFIGDAHTQYPQRQPDLVIGSSFEESQPAAIISEDVAMDVKSLRDAARLAKSRLQQDNVASDQESTREKTLTPVNERTQQRQSPHRTDPHSRLPISPEDSQHRLESQPFETQLTFKSVQSVLPSTPQLTQDDSLTGQGLSVLVDPSAGDADAIQSRRPPPTSSRQTRSSQTAVLTEGLQSPVKKALIRRSPRKSQEQSQETRESQEAATREASSIILHTPVTRQSSLGRPITPPPRAQRTKETAATKKNSLSPKTKTTARRSPRKTRTQTEPQGLAADSRSVAGSKAHKLATDRNSGRSTAPALATRSSEKATIADTVAQDAAQGMQDEVAVRSPSTQSDKSSQPKRPARRSMTSRISAVPAVISNWFSPRRSTRVEIELAPEAEPHLEAEIQAETQAEVKANHDADVSKASPDRRKSNGISTQLSYYTPLSGIREKLNASSQTYGSNRVDVMAVVVDETSKPQRAKSGPRDHFTVFKITDLSLDAGDCTGVEVFKHWHATLPSAQVGDVILLRSFFVRSKKRQPYLLSGDESAWCVWRYAEDEADGVVSSSQKGTPTKPKRMRDRNGSFTIEIKGPPVEYDRTQERQRAEELRAWWLASQSDLDADADADAAVSSQGSPLFRRKPRVQQKL